MPLFLPRPLYLQAIHSEALALIYSKKIEQSHALDLFAISSFVAQLESSREKYDWCILNTATQDCTENARMRGIACYIYLLLGLVQHPTSVNMQRMPFECFCASSADNCTGETVI